jgi:hypothetical protein
VIIFLYQLSLTRARLLGIFPNPANDNNFRLVLGGRTLSTPRAVESRSQV